MAEKRYAMVIDLKKCLGCKTCTIACNTENSIKTADTWNKVIDTVTDMSGSDHTSGYSQENNYTKGGAGPHRHISLLTTLSHHFYKIPQGR